MPNVGRDRQNRRTFTDKDIAWINSLSCLKNCGMGIREMREYLKLCLEGESSILQRKEILTQKRRELKQELDRIRESIAYIDRKQAFYDNVLAGKEAYRSNLK